MAPDFCGCSDAIFVALEKGTRKVIPSTFCRVLVSPLHSSECMILYLHPRRFKHEGCYSQDQYSVDSPNLFSFHKENKKKSLSLYYYSRDDQKTMARSLCLLQSRSTRGNRVATFGGSENRAIIPMTRCIHSLARRETSIRLPPSWPPVVRPCAAPRRRRSDGPGSACTI